MVFNINADMSCIVYNGWYLIIFFVSDIIEPLIKLWVFFCFFMNLFYYKTIYYPLTLTLSRNPLSP